MEILKLHCIYSDLSVWLVRGIPSIADANLVSSLLFFHVHVYTLVNFMLALNKQDPRYCTSSN